MGLPRSLVRRIAFHRRSSAESTGANDLLEQVLLVEVLIGLTLLERRNGVLIETLVIGLKLVCVEKSQTMDIRR